MTKRKAESSEEAQLAKRPRANSGTGTDEEIRTRVSARRRNKKLLKTIDSYEPKYYSSDDEQSYDKDPVVASLTKAQAKEYYRTGIENIARTALPVDDKFKQEIEQYRNLRARDITDGQQYQLDTRVSVGPIAEQLKKTSYEHNPILRRAHKRAVQALIEDRFFDSHFKDKLTQEQANNPEEVYKTAIQIDSMDKDGWHSFQKKLRRFIPDLVKEVSKEHNITPDDFAEPKVARIVDHLQSRKTNYLYSPMKKTSINDVLEKDISGSLEDASWNNATHHNLFKESKDPVEGKKVYKKYEINPANLTLVSNEMHDLVHSAMGLDKKLLDDEDKNMKTDTESQKNYMDLEGTTYVGRELFKNRAYKSDIFAVKIQQRAEAHAKDLSEEAQSLETILKNSQNQPETVLRLGLKASGSHTANLLLELDENKGKARQTA